MKAMIFAAGLGTRLKPLTDSMPKALVPVAGKPLLEHVIVRLRDAGYDSLVVNVHHFPGQIKDFLATHDFGVEIHVSDESDKLLETGGGIRHAAPLLRPLDGPFLVHNVDILSNLDFAWLRAQSRPDALSTLLVNRRETSRYLLFDDRMRLVGWTNVNTGEVRSPYPDLDPAACRRLAFSGIHNMSPGIFDAMEALRMPERFSIIDFYLAACARHPIYGAEAPELRILDVGKPDALARAEDMVRGQSASFL